MAEDKIYFDIIARLQDRDAETRLKRLREPINKVVNLVVGNDREVTRLIEQLERASGNGIRFRADTTEISAARRVYEQLNREALNFVETLEGLQRVDPLRELLGRFNAVSGEVDNLTARITNLRTEIANLNTQGLPLGRREGQLEGLLRQHTANVSFLDDIAREARRAASEAGSVQNPGTVYDLSADRNRARKQYYGGSAPPTGPYNEPEISQVQRRLTYEELRPKIEERQAQYAFSQLSDYSNALEPAQVAEKNRQVKAEISRLGAEAQEADLRTLEDEKQSLLVGPRGVRDHAEILRDKGQVAAEKARIRQIQLGDEKERAEKANRELLTVNPFASNEQFNREKQRAELRNSLPEGFLANRQRPGALSLQRLADPEALQQLGFAAAFGGLPSVIGGALGGAGFGAPGVLVGSTLALATTETITKVIEAFAKLADSAKESGTALEKSILGIASIRQENTEVVDRFGRQVSTGSALQFQQGEARKIQTAARSELAQFGIGGATEATFVQGIVSALAQRGLNPNADQVSQIARLLGGTIQAQRPGLLDNTQQLLKDLQDVLGGGPNASRTVLSQIIRPALPGIQSARTVEGLIGGLQVLAPVANAASQAQNPVVAQQQLQGRLEILNSTAGDAILQALVPAIEKLTEVVKDPEFIESVTELAGAFGELEASGLELTADLLKSLVGPFNGLAEVFKDLAISGDALHTSIEFFKPILDVLAGGSAKPLESKEVQQQEASEDRSAKNRAALATLGKTSDDLVIEGIQKDIKTSLESGEIFKRPDKLASSVIGTIFSGFDFEKQVQLGQKLSEQQGQEGVEAAQGLTARQSTESKVRTALTQLGLQSELTKETAKAETAPEVAIPKIEELIKQTETGKPGEVANLSQQRVELLSILSGQQEKAEGKQEKLFDTGAFGNLAKIQARQAALPGEIATQDRLIKEAQAERDRRFSFRGRGEEIAALTKTKENQIRSKTDLEDQDASPTRSAKLRAVTDDLAETVKKIDLAGKGLGDNVIDGEARIKSYQEGRVKLAQDTLEAARQEADAIKTRTSLVLSSISTGSAGGKVEAANAQLSGIIHEGLGFEDRLAKAREVEAQTGKKGAVAEVSAVEAERIKREVSANVQASFGAAGVFSTEEKKLGTSTDSATGAEERAEIEAQANDQRKKTLGVLIESYDAQEKELQSQIAGTSSQEEKEGLLAREVATRTAIGDLILQQKEIEQTNTINLLNAKHEYFDKIGALTEESIETGLFGSKSNQLAARGLKLAGDTGFAQERLGLAKNDAERNEFGLKLTAAQSRESENRTAQGQGNIERLQKLTQADNLPAKLQDSARELAARFDALSASINTTKTSLEDFDKAERLRRQGAQGQRIAAADQFLKAGGSINELDAQTAAIEGSPELRSQFELDTARENLRQTERQTAPERLRQQNADQRAGLVNAAEAAQSAKDQFPGQARETQLSNLAQIYSTYQSLDENAKKSPLGLRLKAALDAAQGAVQDNPLNSQGQFGGLDAGGAAGAAILGGTLEDKIPSLGKIGESIKPFKPADFADLDKLDAENQEAIKKLQETKHAFPLTRQDPKEDTSGGPPQIIGGSFQDDASKAFGNGLDAISEFFLGPKKAPAARRSEFNSATGQTEKSDFTIDEDPAAKADAEKLAKQRLKAFNSATGQTEQSDFPASQDPASADPGGIFAGFLNSTNPQGALAQITPKNLLGSLAKQSTPSTLTQDTVNQKSTDAAQQASADVSSKILAALTTIASNTSSQTITSDFTAALNGAFQ